MKTLEQLQLETNLIRSFKAELEEIKKEPNPIKRFLMLKFFDLKTRAFCWVGF